MSIKLTFRALALRSDEYFEYHIQSCLEQAKVNLRTCISFQNYVKIIKSLFTVL